MVLNLVERSPAIGVELNPAAYNLSKTYELINVSVKTRQKIMADFYSRLETAFDLPQLLGPDDPIIFGKSATPQLNSRNWCMTS